MASEPTIIMRGGGLLAGGPAGREPQKHDRKGRRRMRAGAGSALRVPHSHLDLADSAHVPAPSRKIDYQHRHRNT